MRSWQKSLERKKKALKGISKTLMALMTFKMANDKFQLVGTGTGCQRALAVSKFHQNRQFRACKAPSNASMATILVQKLINLSKCSYRKRKSADFSPDIS